MNSFLQLDCGKYPYYLANYYNYSISYLLENNIEGIVFNINFHQHKVSVIFSYEEKLYAIYCSTNKMVVNIYDCYSLKQTLNKCQELINYYTRIDKLKSFS